MLGTIGFGQSKVNWLTWEQAVEKNMKEKRKIVVDVYTDWCGWCKKMDKYTFQTEFIADYINEHYYAVKFNAEQKEEINFNGKVYKYVSSFGRRGYHELASEILNGRMSYPTVVFLDENQNVIQPIPGYQDAQTFEMIMTYFAENHYQSVPWQKFTRSFKSQNYPSAQPKRIVQPVRNN
ncbi:MAG: DUF255 domain-containing protein [Bacteroidia bacterium]|nr:DUF255 domain-containing protein [Bacteroidia bacterium]